MGIPYLTATLEPYAVRRALQDEVVVIDGPALAYHILHVCRVNGISQPPYQLLGQSTVAWLDNLSSHGVAAQAIYFDGHLPTSKRQVRMERLTKSTAQISRFFSSTPQGCPRNQLDFVAGDDDAGRLDILGTGIPGTKPFADPSFLVPAIIDALRQSPQYQALVFLVPGEADIYCAKHVLKQGGSVLTSDSDLLAHTLGDGQVVFFRDLHRDTNSAILCSSFAPKDICQKLGLSPLADPLRLAYERKRLPYARLPQLVRACSGSVLDQSDYHTFRQEYEHHEGDELPDWRLPQLNRLDPRVSEIVVQLHHASSKPNGKHDVRMYLPVLIESPTKGNAWEQSTPVRQLAYTLLRLASAESSAPILEYRRIQSTTQKGRKIETVSAVEAQRFIDEMLDLMKRLKQVTCGHERFYWPVLCLALDMCECQKQDKQSQAWHIFQQRQKPSVARASKISWDVVHFVAQLQATCYSLRILRQVLFIVLDGEMELIPPNIKQLKTALMDLPPLIDFPNMNSTLDILVTSGQKGLVRALGELLGVSLPVAPKPSDNFKVTKNVKKRTGGKRRDEVSDKLTLKSKASTADNKFSLLSVD
ncbi:hypothetical protein TOPH_04192 [Tolypocladium ophioglossoides CBS 100239]|uniref:Asteroid domain-containing protein n=1 Tax=Tolypocladium ophioglossoides (strain CBS 100239) TaxID=1163406 RepID=A0A0L0NCA4_TOLOC|nr:hypothetical protein TOPH_04192 [Tolypocladium ophioglossoides CBS 100239]